MLGVTGLDLSMDEVISTMPVPDLGGDQVAMLLDQEGRVLLTSSERGIVSEVSMQDQRTKERRAVGVPALGEAIRAGSASGFIHEGNDLYLYAGLNAVPWTLVARVEASAFGID